MSEVPVPLWPGSTLAVRYPQGWIALSDAYAHCRAEFPPEPVGSEVTCDQSSPPDWHRGWQRVMCTNHVDGYHVAAAGLPDPRVIAVWRDGAS